MPRFESSDVLLLKNMKAIVKPLLTEPKRSIIKILSDGEKSSNEIFEALKELGISIPKSTLYYHLSTLVNAGIIEQVGYREEGGGAPEKMWRLKVKRIGIDIVDGKLFME